jgi:hypothetical protein
MRICSKPDSSGLPEGLLGRPFDGRIATATIREERASACLLTLGFSRRCPGWLGDEKEAEAPLKFNDACLPSRKTAGLVTLRESRMNAARSIIRC